MRFRYKPAVADDRKIDMTPIIDIVFNLLLFFLLSSSYVQHTAIDVKLPESTTGEKMESEPVIIEITRDERIFIDGEATNFEGLRLSLGEKYADAVEEPRPLLIRADAYAYHGRIVTVLDLARELGITALNIETLPSERAVGENSESG